MNAAARGALLLSVSGCATTKAGAAADEPQRLRIDDPAYGAFEGAPNPGDHLEDAELLSVEGQRLRTDELRGSGALALVFYPGRQIVDSRSWLASFEEHLAEFDAAGIALVAISTDPIERGRELTEQLGLTFPVAVDPRLSAIELFGVRDPGRPARALPAVLLVDGRGTVVYRKVGGRPAEPREVLAAHHGWAWRCCPGPCTLACEVEKAP